METVIFEARVLKSDDLLGACKLAINIKFEPSIPKILPARTKKHTDMTCEYHYLILN